MHGWLQITAVAVAAATAAGVVILVVFLRRRFSSSNHEDLGEMNSAVEIGDNVQIGISKLSLINLQNHHHNLDLDSRVKTNNYYVFKPEVSNKTRFNWADHPSLVTDAVENGWSRFAFAASYTSSSQSVRSSRSTLLGSCAAGDRRESGMEISWEICPGSSDFVQKIRINPGLKKPNPTHSVIKTGLPLPGPPLGNSAFPQEAYFEITILEDDGGYEAFGSRKRSKIDGEKAKLIQENRIAKRNSDSVVHVTSNKKVEELRGGGEEELSNLTVGITTGKSLKIPGSYPGSIGFNSDGSVFLDGIKLISETKKEEWAKADKVIGCGYNPNQRKVFFTVDSQLMHVINCKSDDFGTPLYPTLASNIDMTILVNFGQSVFQYTPANSQRTPNPCFIGHLANSPALSYEDSKELFSMGRIDSQWLNRCATRTGHHHHHHNYGSNNCNSKGLEFDVESEGDLFEIVLDRSGKSPNTVLH